MGEDGARSGKWSGVFQSALWAAAWLPAFFALSWVLKMKGRVPYHDSWAFAWQYLEWQDGRLGWREFFSPHNGHPSAVGKAIYFAVMEWERGDVSVLPVLSWLFSLIIAFAVLRLGRPLGGRWAWIRPGLLLLANLAIFTPAHGHTWVWDFVFQNFIPGCCLMAALWLLDSAKGWKWRLPAAFLLSGLATFAFGSGYLVGLLLAPMVYLLLPASWTFRRRAGLVSAWLAGVVFLAWLALAGLDQAGTRPGMGGRLEDLLLHRPWMTFQYLLVLFGHTLAEGWVFEPVQVGAVVGGVLLAGWLGGFGMLVLRCREREGWRAGLPWIICGAWAMGNACMICLARLNATLETALAPRYATFMHFMVLGVVFLVAALFRHPALHAVLPARLRRSGPGWIWGVLTLLLVCQAAEWEAGRQKMLAASRRMDSEQAALVFAKVLPLNREVQWDPGVGFDVLRLVRELGERGRLRAVRMVPDARLDRLSKGPPLIDKFASFELVHHVADGLWSVQGTCGLSKDRTSLPDLILLTAASGGGGEEIFAFAAPVLPDDFHERLIRRRVHPEHYMGWRHRLDTERLPRGVDLVLRAYAFTGGSLRIRQIPGEQHLRLP